MFLLVRSLNFPSYQEFSSHRDPKHKFGRSGARFKWVRKTDTTCMHQNFKKGPQIVRLKSPLLVKEGELIGIMGLNVRSGGLEFGSLAGTKPSSSKRMSLSLI